MTSSASPSLGNKPIIVIVGLIASVIAIIAFVTGKQTLSEFLNASDSTAVADRNKMPVPTTARQSPPTLAPTFLETIRTEISVPCNNKAGTRVDAPISGRSMISYVSGSYSAEPGVNPSDLHWRSRVSIYRNRNVEFGAREFQQGDAAGITYYEPTSPDVIFDGNYTKMTQAQSEAAARAAAIITLDLAKGEFLIFVCMDDKPYFQQVQN